MIKVKLDLLIDIDVLLMVDVIRWEIRHFIHRYAKANDKHMKDYDKNKESSYFQYWDVNNLYHWTISQKVPVSHYVWIKDIVY